MPIVEQGHGIKKMGSSQSVSVIEQYVTTGGPLHRKTREKSIKPSSESFHPRGRRLWYFIPTMGFPGDSVVKNLPAVLETWVPSLIREDSLEREMAIHSSILAWEIPWTNEPGGLSSMVLQRVCLDLATKPANHLQELVNTVGEEWGGVWMMLIS